MILICLYFAVVYFVAGTVYFSLEGKCPATIASVRGHWVVLSIEENNRSVRPVLGTKCSFVNEEYNKDGCVAYSLNRTIILYTHGKEVAKTTTDEKAGILSYKKNTIQLVKETIIKTNNDNGKQ